MKCVSTLNVLSLCPGITLVLVKRLEEDSTRLKAVDNRIKMPLRIRGTAKNERGYVPFLSCNHSISPRACHRQFLAASKLHQAWQPLV